MRLKATHSSGAGGTDRPLDSGPLLCELGRHARIHNYQQQLWVR